MHVACCADLAKAKYHLTRPPLPNVTMRLRLPHSLDKPLTQIMVLATCTSTCMTSTCMYMQRLGGFTLDALFGVASWPTFNQCSHV